MNTTANLIDSADSPITAFAQALDSNNLEQRTPAALAKNADPRTSRTYAFLSTEHVIDALRCAGFVPISASQTRSRRGSPMFARHVIRFRRQYETVQLRDCIPEILFLNSHDGRTATQFRLALFRPVCTNGLIVCDETLPVWRVPHRGNTIDEVIAAAIAQSEQFEAVGAWVERMERMLLDEPQRLGFAARAIALRFPKGLASAIEPAQILRPQRAEDQRRDLWTTYNVIQERIIKGGLEYRSASNRHMQSRGIKGIREDLRLNSTLWQMATALAA